MYVYILHCSDNSYYTGVTNDYERRLYEHSEGIDRNSYTYTRRPLTLVFVEDFPDPDSAIAFEKQVKGWSRAKKEALIANKFELLPGLSRSYTEKKQKKLDSLRPGANASINSA